MKLKQPVMVCDLCSSQQIDNGDDTEILGITIVKAFYAGFTGGGPVPKDTFICIDCIVGNAEHGPALLDVLRVLVFHDPKHDTLDIRRVYAPKPRVRGKTKP